MITKDVAPNRIEWSRSYASTRARVAAERKEAAELEAEVRRVEELKRKKETEEMEALLRRRNWRRCGWPN